MSWIKERIDSEYRKHKELEWSKIAERKIIAKIMEYCYKNNTLKFKDSKLKLALTDGGWINVLELKEFLEGK